MIENDSLIVPRVEPKSKRFYITLGLSILVALTGVIAISVYNLNQPPRSFTPTSITIEPGSTVRAIAKQVNDKGLVKSESLLYFTLVLLFEPRDVKASTYIFNQPLTTNELAKRLTTGDFTADLIRFTHFEGERAARVASRAALVLENFDEEQFIELATPVEGRLFPETYLLRKNFSAAELVALMTNTFDSALAPYEEAIAQSELTLDEIIVLASIIEREANSRESMRFVSGILQNRLAINMALQADASIEYVLNKPLRELTPADLEIDSPYNTYLNTGLPPTPIGNPGLTAIEAVLFPEQTDYFFYLTDDTGVFHYAVTYDQHLANINRYLR